MSPRGIYPRRGRPASSSDTGAPAPSTVASSEPVKLSTRTQRMIDDIRAPFTAFSHEFRAIIETRAKLAPRFMKAYGAWQSETGGTFPAFVRVLDPDVPEKRDDYRAHPSFAAADYLRRIVSRAEQDRVERETGESTDIPATPLEAVASLLSTVLPLVADPDTLWSALKDRLHWTENQVNRAKTLASHVDPLLSSPKNVKPVLRLAA